MLNTFFDAFNTLQIYQWVLLGAFAIVFLLKFAGLFLFPGKIVFQQLTFAEKSVPFSLILTFRNEEDNLKKNLPPLLNSIDNESEVVAVDDFSQDNSLPVLGVLRRKYANLKVSSLNQETLYSGKMAQNIALKAAKNEWVLVVPPSISEYEGLWLPGISSNFNEETNFVVNYSNIRRERKFINMIYRCELFFQQLKSVGFIKNGLAYIGFEENVAFRKGLYFEAGGFRKNVTEHFANLELLINSFIKKRKTSVAFHKNTVIRKQTTVYKNDYFDLLKKEIRIVKNLPFFKRFIHFSSLLLNLLFFASVVLVFLFVQDLWILIFALLAIYFIVFAFIIKIIHNRLNERKLFLSSLGYAVLAPCFKLAYRAFLSYSKRKKRWKSNE